MWNKKTFPAVNECPLLFVDVETSGLSDDSEIVEIAAILTDPSGGEVRKEWSAKVRPTRPVDPQAAAINGYDPEVWAREAVDLRAAMSRISQLSWQAVFAAHNATFDWRFVSAGLESTGHKWHGRYHRIDTVALAWPLLARGHVQKVRLGDLTEHFGLAQASAHRALSDVQDCRAVYLRLMELWDMAVEYNPPLMPVGSRQDAKEVNHG